MSRIPLLLAAALTLPTAAAAQGRSDRAQDRHELARDRHERRDDERDLRRLEGLVARFDEVRARHDRRGLAEVERALDAELQSEAEESRAELARDRHEVRRDVRHGEDRRETRDDVWDLRREQAIAARRDAIARELGALRGDTHSRALERKRALMVELVGLARGELAADVGETREDRRELRQDGGPARERW